MRCVITQSTTFTISMAQGEYLVGCAVSKSTATKELITIFLGTQTYSTR